MVLVLGRWPGVRLARDLGIGDRPRDPPRFRPASTSTAIGSRYERRSVALDHAGVLEEVGSADRVRREALRQEFLEKGPVLRERRSCTGERRRYFPLIDSNLCVIALAVRLERDEERERGRYRSLADLL